MRYRFLRFPGGKLKAVTLSYDDNCRADLRFAEVINRCGMKCTFNVNSGMYGNTPGEGWQITKEEIAMYLQGAGHEIALHNHLHVAPGVISPMQGIQEVLQCRLSLERDFGGIIRGMAYPDTGITRLQNGVTYEDIRHYLMELGVAYARTLGEDNDGFYLPNDWYAWVPTAHHNNPRLMEWIDRFLAIREEELYCAHRLPRLFYLWGHAFEFDNNNNWDRLDEICEKLAGHEDIWYATNIQVCDYVRAYEQLVVSADSTRLYNPTCTTVWFDVDGRIYMIQPGETVNLEV